MMKSQKADLHLPSIPKELCSAALRYGGKHREQLRAILFKGILMLTEVVVNRHLRHLDPESKARLTSEVAANAMATVHQVLNRGIGPLWHCAERDDLVGDMQHSLVWAYMRRVVFREALRVLKMRHNRMRINLDRADEAAHEEQIELAVDHRGTEFFVGLAAKLRFLLPRRSRDRIFEPLLRDIAADLRGRKFQGRDSLHIRLWFGLIVFGSIVLILMIQVVEHIATLLYQSLRRSQFQSGDD